MDIQLARGNYFLFYNIFPAPFEIINVQIRDVWVARLCFRIDNTMHVNETVDIVLSAFKLILNPKSVYVIACDPPDFLEPIYAISKGNPGLCVCGCTLGKIAWLGLLASDGVQV